MHSSTGQLGDWFSELLKRGVDGVGAHRVADVQNEMDDEKRPDG